jgi:hypothetical protein
MKTKNYGKQVGTIVVKISVQGMEVEREVTVPIMSDTMYPIGSPNQTGVMPVIEAAARVAQRVLKITK